MKNWKTTLGGFLVAVGGALAASDDNTIKVTGIIVGAIGALFLGGNAKDRDVTGAGVSARRVK